MNLAQLNSMQHRLITISEAFLALGLFLIVSNGYLHRLEWGTRCPFVLNYPDS